MAVAGFVFVRLVRCLPRRRRPSYFTINDADKFRVERFLGTLPFQRQSDRADVYVISFSLVYALGRSSVDRFTVFFGLLAAISLFQSKLSLPNALLSST